jgi:iron complex outermembrane receptor protein
VFGVETMGEYTFENIPFKYLRVKYGFNEAFEKKGIVSKYVLNYLKHNIIAETVIDYPMGVRQELRLSFKKRIGDAPYFLMDSEIYKEIVDHPFKMRLFLKGENLLNTDYTEVGSVKMPGIWVTAGVELEY